MNKFLMRPNVANQVKEARFLNLKMKIQRCLQPFQDRKPFLYTLLLKPLREWTSPKLRSHVVCRWVGGCEICPRRFSKWGRTICFPWVCLQSCREAGKAAGLGFRSNPTAPSKEANRNIRLTICTAPGRPLALCHCPGTLAPNSVPAWFCAGESSGSEGQAAGKQSLEKDKEQKKVEEVGEKGRVKRR